MEKHRSLIRALPGVVVASLLSCRDAPPRLPELPPPGANNAVTIARFEQARSEALATGGPAAIGRLGMMFHAYQLHAEASACYDLAAAKEPDSLDWAFYRALAEKARYEYELAEESFLRALELAPEDAEIHAELGELYLMWSRRDDAEAHLDRALELEPLQPLGALGRARLLTLEGDWDGVVDTMRPLLERYPRLSRAHQYVAAAYGALGDAERQAFHQEAGEYGAAVESDRRRALDELAVDALLDGDPGPGAELLQVKCARCHDHERIYDRAQDRRWCALTVRRMQREAGWEWLTDDEAASVVAYLAERTSD